MSMPWIAQVKKTTQIEQQTGKHHQATTKEPGVFSDQGVLARIPLQHTHHACKTSKTDHS